MNGGKREWPYKIRCGVCVCVFVCVCVCPLAWMQVVRVKSIANRTWNVIWVWVMLAAIEERAAVYAHRTVLYVCVCVCGSKALQVQYIWKGIPWAWIVGTDWPRCACHAILMPLPTNGCGWGAEGVKLCVSARVSFWSDPESSSNILCTHLRGFNPSWCCNITLKEVARESGPYDFRNHSIADRINRKKK